MAKLSIADIATRKRSAKKKYRFLMIIVLRSFPGPSKLAEHYTLAPGFRESMDQVADQRFSSA